MSGFHAFSIRRDLAMRQRFSAFYCEMSIGNSRKKTLITSVASWKSSNCLNCGNRFFLPSRRNRSA